MKRIEQHRHNHKVIAVLINQMGSHFRTPSYKASASVLNAQGLLTSRGNTWTPRRLFRMLQRNGYSGLWGLRRSVQT